MSLRPTILGSQKLMAFIATCDPGRAKTFYRDTLGLHLISEDKFALVFDAAGTILRVTTTQEVGAVKYTVFGGRFLTSCVQRKGCMKRVSHLKDMRGCSKTSPGFGTRLGVQRRLVQRSRWKHIEHHAVLGGGICRDEPSTPPALPFRLLEAGRRNNNHSHVHLRRHTSYLVGQPRTMSSTILDCHMRRGTIDFEIVRNIGLALPGVEESTAYGSRRSNSAENSWRVCPRIAKLNPLRFLFVWILMIVPSCWLRLPMSTT